MAPQTKTTTQGSGPLHDVRSETINSLIGIGSELDKADADIAALESLGFDVSKLKERAAWGRKAIDVIGARFKQA